MLPKTSGGRIMNDIMNAGSSQQPTIGKLPDGTTLTPLALKHLECKTKIEKLCLEYNLMLVPTFQIMGDQIASNIQLMARVDPSEVAPTEAPADG